VRLQRTELHRPHELGRSVRSEGGLIPSVWHYPDYQTTQHATSTTSDSLTSMITFRTLRAIECTSDTHGDQ
jgi:hypothetical protein